MAVGRKILKYSVVIVCIVTPKIRMDFTQLMKNTPESTKLGHSTHAIACIVMKTSKLKGLEQQQHESCLL